MDQNRSRNDDMPSRQSNMEPAEGSRETVRNSEGTTSRQSPSAAHERVRNSGGITNRPLDREQCEQQQIPERGQSQSER